VVIGWDIWEARGIKARVIKKWGGDGEISGLELDVGTAKSYEDDKGFSQENYEIKPNIRER